MTQMQLNTIRNLNGYLSAMKISRTALAEKVGVSISTVNHWLNEKSNSFPNEEQLRKCAAVLGVSCMDMFRPYDAETAKKRCSLQGYVDLYAAVFSREEASQMEPVLCKIRMENIMFKVLTAGEKRLLDLYYGIDRGDSKTLWEIQHEYGITDRYGSDHMLKKVLWLLQDYYKWEEASKLFVPEQLCIKEVYEANGEFMAKAAHDACMALDNLKESRSFLTLGRYHDEYEDCVKPEQTPIAILDFKLIPYNQEPLLDRLRENHVYTLDKLFQLTKRELHELKGIGDIYTERICALRSACVTECITTTA